MSVLGPSSCWAHRLLAIYVVHLVDDDVAGDKNKPVRAERTTTRRHLCEAGGKGLGDEVTYEQKHEEEWGRDIWGRTVRQQYVWLVQLVL